MVAAAKKPVTMVRAALKQLRNLEFVITRNKVDVSYTPEYNMYLKGKLMLTIYIPSKIAVFYHPQHYIHERDFEARLKPLVDPLFKNRYTLMSYEEYEERAKSGNNDRFFKSRN
jgi:hypothetical protein